MFGDLFWFLFVYQISSGATVGMIRRFGGSTSTSAQWPKEAADNEYDQLDRIEKLVEKAIKRMGSYSKEKSYKNHTKPYKKHINSYK